MQALDAETLVEGFLGVVDIVEVVRETRFTLLAAASHLKRCDRECGTCRSSEA